MNPARDHAGTPAMARGGDAGSGNQSPKPRLGFVGVGWIGRQRMETILASGLAECAAIFEPAADVAASALAVAPGAERAESFGELLDLDLDGVVIATPSALHAEQAIAALERGIPVFCQKPLGRNAAEVAAVVDAAARADRLLGVDLSYRSAEAFRVAREVVRSGAIGDVFAVDLVFHNAYGPDKPWFYDPALAGGGCVMDLGVHLVDLALWALDFPDVERVDSRLFAKGRPVDSGSAVEDFAEARIDLVGGVAVRLSCSWNLHAGCHAVISASFFGTRGGCRTANVNGSFYDFTAERLSGTERDILVRPPDAWSGRRGVEWAAQLARSNRFDPAATQFTAVAQVLDGIYDR